MSRGLSGPNQAQVALDHVTEVTLVKLDFDSPVYIHSGIGTITYNLDDYLGVGKLGAVSNTTEREQPTPTALKLSLSGVDAGLVSEALDAGNFGDRVEVYVGFRADDGTLVDDPIPVWAGTYDYARATGGQNNVIELTCQHDLAVLNKVQGGRFSDEDQQLRYSGDTGFQFVSNMAGLKLTWGGGAVSAPRPFAPPWKDDLVIR